MEKERKEKDKINVIFPSKNPVCIVERRKKEERKREMYIEHGERERRNGKRESKR